jgi:hypothetical protein
MTEIDAKELELSPFQSESGKKCPSWESDVLLFLKKKNIVRKILSFQHFMVLIPIQTRIKYHQVSLPSKKKKYK